MSTSIAASSECDFGPADGCYLQIELEHVSSIRKVQTFRMERRTARRMERRPVKLLDVVERLQEELHERFEGFDGNPIIVTGHVIGWRASELDATTVTSYTPYPAGFLSPDDRAVARRDAERDLVGWGHPVDSVGVR
jgi:hypothetical protein